MWNSFKSFPKAKYVPSAASSSSPRHSFLKERHYSELAWLIPAKSMSSPFYLLFALNWSCSIFFFLNYFWKDWSLVPWFLFFKGVNCVCLWTELSDLTCLAGASRAATNASIIAPAPACTVHMALPAQPQSSLRPEQLIWKDKERTNLKHKPGVKGREGRGLAHTLLSSHNK